MNLSWASCQLVLLITWATVVQSSNLTTVVIIASCLAFLASLTAVVLSYTEHTKSPRPSTILISYLFLSLIADAATLRTTWQADIPTPIRVISTTTFTFKAAVLLFEAREKQAWLISTGKAQCPEETTGIFSRAVFWWINSLLIRGFRQLLRPGDLYPMQMDMSAAVLDEKFWIQWNRGWIFHQRIILIFQELLTLL